MEGDPSSTTGAISQRHLGWEGLAFHKYEGLGNDFVVIETEREDAVPAAVVRQLCDRRRGIGADGVLLVVPPKDAKMAGRMVVLNADGSIPEMCGNGLRCVALHVARQRGATKDQLVFETGAGAKTCVIDDTDRRGSISVDMGAVRWLGDIRLDLDGDPWDLSLADAGNPHAITRREASRAQIEAIGPRIATHSRFGGGTNVEFAIVRSPTHIDLVVWERGVGITEACGTGACATAAVAVEKGWAAPNTDIAVRLPGGILQVNVRDEGKQVIMTGPARHVFSGKIEGPGTWTSA
jgi:diaminopimelate epimerase